MPGRNGTGPAGCGPMTGRGFGPCCANADYPQGSGRFVRGAGMGYGMGRRNRFNCAPHPYYAQREISPQEQKEILKQQKEFLQAELDNINSTLDEL